MTTPPGTAPIGPEVGLSATEIERWVYWAVARTDCFGLGYLSEHGGGGYSQEPCDAEMHGRQIEAQWAAERAGPDAKAVSVEIIVREVTP